jgi:hypothetical protein
MQLKVRTVEVRVFGYPWAFYVKTMETEKQKAKGERQNILPPTLHYIKVMKAKYFTYIFLKMFQAFSENVSRK